MHHRHPLKTILLTIQIYHPCLTSGLKVQTGKALSRLHQHHLLPLCQQESQDLFVGTVEKQNTRSATVQACKQKGHLPVKCPLKGKRKETSQMPQKAPQMFSSIRNKCIHCGGDHAPGACTTRIQPQATPSTVGYQVYNNSTGAGKINHNASLSFSSKNSQSAAASTALSSLVNNSTAQGRASCTQEPWITPQVSPSTSQQNSYNIPPMQPPNQFAPPPYFPIPFPPSPIALSNVSNAPSAPVSDISAAITLMMNAMTQGSSNDKGWTSSLRRSRYLMVPNPPSVTHGWRRYTLCVFKQEGLFKKCCYYVQVRLSAISSQTCPRKQRMIKSRMISSQVIQIYKA